MAPQLFRIWVIDIINQLQNMPKNSKENGKNSQYSVIGTRESWKIQNVISGNAQKLTSTLEFFQSVLLSSPSSSPWSFIYEQKKMLSLSMDRKMVSLFTNRKMEWLLLTRKNVFFSFLFFSFLSLTKNEQKQNFKKRQG